MSKGALVAFGRFAELVVWSWYPVPTSEIPTEGKVAIPLIVLAAWNSVRVAPAGFVDGTIPN